MKISDFIDSVSEPILKGNLSDFLYLCGELNVFIDCIDSMSEEQAIQIYKIVKLMIEHDLPKEFIL
jgi:hypothetical protein